MPALLASSSLGLLFLGLVVAAIVALHRLKPRPSTHVVASLALWEVALRRTGARRSSWRWWLALLLSVSTGALLAVTLIRPEVQGVGDGSRRAVVIVDNGSSMATRTLDGKTRWLHALARARSVIRSAPGLVMVMDGAGRTVAARFEAPAAALASLDRLALTAAGAGPPPPLPEITDLEVHFISDGVTPYPLPPGAIVHSVFEPADNVAVIRLVARPLAADPLKVEAFVQVLNASPGEKSVRLTLRGGERFVLVQDLRLAAGERVDATFDVSDFPGGVLAAAAITAGDALANDDIAYTLVAPHRTQRIRLVTRGNAALADALAALPGVRVEIVDPARYRPESGIDAYVFDGFAPEQPPGAGALLFRPSATGWLPTAGRVQGPATIDSWDRANPLASGIAWDTLTIGRASPWTHWPDTVEAVVRAGAGALILSGRTEFPWTAVAFLPGDTDLPLQPAFTVFLGNALARLTGTDAAASEPLGTIRVALANGEVRDGHGRRIESRNVPGATLFDAERPDIYTVRGAHTRLQVAAGVLDPLQADINRSRLTATDGIPVPGVALPFERWVVIVLACLGLLVFDWAAYTRRITR